MPTSRAAHPPAIPAESRYSASRYSSVNSVGFRGWQRSSPADWCIGWSLVLLIKGVVGPRPIDLDLGAGLLTITEHGDAAFVAAAGICWSVCSQWAPGSGQPRLQFHLLDR